jgi:hypothetical protein
LARTTAFNRLATSRARVAGGVTSVVVDGLEVVQVEKDHRDRPAVVPRSRQRALHVRHQVRWFGSSVIGSVTASFAIVDAMTLDARARGTATSGTSQ